MEPQGSPAPTKPCLLRAWYLHVCFLHGMHSTYGCQISVGVCEMKQAAMPGGNVPLLLPTPAPWDRAPWPPIGRSQVPSLCKSPSWADSLGTRAWVIVNSLSPGPVIIEMNGPESTYHLPRNAMGGTWWHFVSWHQGKKLIKPMARTLDSERHGAQGCRRPL